MSTPPACNQPLVTVITATYNIVKAGRGDFFRQSVESVHNQTYANIEHIIVDGASTDGTRDLIAEFEEKGWVTCISEPDKGVYDAMNKGIKAARGKYIAFLNTDDYWHNERGIALSVHLLELQQADFSYAPHEMLGEGDVSIGTHPTAVHTFFCVLPFCHQTMLCRTELLRERGGFDDKTFRVCADFDFMHELFVSGRKSVYVPLCFTRFRLGGLSCTALETDRQERLTIFRRYYGPIIGDEAAEKLNEMVIPGELIHALAPMVNENVRRMMLETHLPTSAPAPATCVVMQTHMDEKESARILMGSYNELRRRYHYCSLMSKLTWGKRRKRYKEQKHKWRRLLREIRAQRREALAVYGLRA